ncbi:ribosomal-processing cysteine protease Prp [Mycoplasmatota bacterium]|nr:ribosomal-processing cysteine protease Prp [Mycoplasmatota bacterium]
MIKVDIRCDLNEIKYIEVTGHALYDQSGKDIVCASVSTALIMTINALEKLNVLDDVKYDIEEGYFQIEVNGMNHLVKAMLDNLQYSLTDLSNQYPKYIKIKKEG